MSAIGKGDWVEYIGKPAGYVSQPGATEYVLGALYRVTEIGRRAVDGAGQIWPSIRLAGMRVANERGRPVSAPVAAFRPIYRPNSELIDFLKQPAPERELQDV